MVNHTGAILIQAFRIGSVVVVKLGQIPPNDLLLVVHAIGIGYSAVRLPHKPFRMLLGDLRVDRTMINDKIDH